MHTLDPNNLPNKSHYAIVTLSRPSSIEHEDSERYEWTYEREEWEAEIKKRAGLAFGDKFLAINAVPAIIKTHISVSLT